MADSYIDPNETQIYGPFAREQMKDVCIGRIPELDDMVRFAIAKQKSADAAMKAVLDKQPRDTVRLSEAEALAEARDVIVRFGSYLGSLKGRPVDPQLFFGREAPSVLARRRITKLAGALKHMLDEFELHKTKLAKSWQAEISAAYDGVAALEKQHRSQRVEQTDAAPDVATAREAWLAVYTANKALIRGLLAHAGKPELLPLIFDDLAETQRASGVTPDPAPPVSPPVASPPATSPPAASTPAASSPASGGAPAVGSGTPTP